MLGKNEIVTCKTSSGYAAKTAAGDYTCKTNYH